MRGGMDAVTYPALEAPWRCPVYKPVKQEHDDSGISPGRSGSDGDGPSPGRARPSSTPLQAVAAAAAAPAPRRPESSPAAADPLLGLQRALDALSQDVLTCPLCEFSTSVRSELTEHLASHYPQKCSDCDFRCQGADQLRAHLQERHDRATPSPATDPDPEDTGEDDDQPGVRIPRVNSQGKVKTFRCKQCDFVAVTKLAFWEHSRGHIKAERLLTCPKCPFVTEYKHHLEYHLRNHFGSKPFKCDQCSYSCVNKSMLNSHLKSHSNVYQYRCADCNYATKYCHSLKLHLRKYSHQPAMVLNADGSPNPLPIIDVYGTRRGPKQRLKGAGDDSPFGALGVPFPYGPLLSGAFPPPNSSPVPAFPYGAPDTPREGSPDNHGSAAQEDLRFLDCRQQLHLDNGVKDFPVNQCTRQTVTAMDFRQRILDNNNSLQPNGHLQMDRGVQERVNGYVLYPQQAPRHGDQDAPRLPQPYSRPHDSAPSNGDDLSHVEQSSGNESALLSHSAARGEKAWLGSNPLDLSKPDAPAPAPAVKNRRKGKAYKLERIAVRLQTQQEPESRGTPEKAQCEDAATYSCTYCDITFRDIVMYTMHMGYHGYKDPFQCNMCGHQTADRVAFFLHIARSSHC